MRNTPCVNSIILCLCAVSLFLKRKSCAGNKSVISKVTLTNRNHNRCILMASTVPLTLETIQAARNRIRGFVHRTPVLTCSYLDQLSGFKLYFKCENLQKTGSFKIRGALNAISLLGERGNTRDTVVTHSSGNHAQALALAAKLKGLKAHIVMPNITTKIKKEAVRGYDADITECEPTDKSRQETADRVVQEVNGVFVSPANDFDIMAGQGTMALEMLEQVEDLDCIMAAVGGGGMISGICVAAKSSKPGIKVIAAEPAAADDCARSLAAGRIIPNKSPPDVLTIADGVRVSLGNKCWQVIQQYLDHVITVSEEQIASAMRVVWERMKLVIEPSAAVPVAVVLYKGEEIKRKYPDLHNIGIVLCGGNVDLNRLPWMEN